MADPANGRAKTMSRAAPQCLAVLILLIGATLALALPRAGTAPKAGADERLSSATTPPAPLDADGLLAKLKAMDARFEDGVTAAGTCIAVPARYGDLDPQRIRWKISMDGRAVAYEEEVIEVLRWKDVLGPGEEPPPRSPRGKLMMHFRKTILTGPEYYAVCFLMGLPPPKGPMAPWPEGEAGPATSAALMVHSPDDPAYLGQIDRRMQLLGRWYSRYIDRITRVSIRDDGLISCTADGTKYKGEDFERHLKWEFVIDPKAGYMMRSAKLDVVGIDDEHEERVLTGLKRHGDLCVPETVRPHDERYPHTIMSVSSKPDIEFIKRCKTGTHGPFVVRTDLLDRRVKKRSSGNFGRGEFKPGESWTDK